MPIALTYRKMQIQPGTVDFHGQVIIAAGPIIDTALTITPGMTVARTGVGLYTLTFNGGVTVGFTAINFTNIIAATGTDPLSFAVLAAGMIAGASVINLEISTITVPGTLTDPGTGDGFSYDMTRLNTSVVVP